MTPLRAKVLHASRYSFTDENTGRTIEGSKVTYLGESVQHKDSKGCQIITLSGPHDVYSNLPNLPADLDLYISVQMKGSPKPKPVMVLEGVALPK